MLENKGIFWAIIVISILIRQFREEKYKNKHWWALPLVMICISFQVVYIDFLRYSWDALLIIIAFIAGTVIGWYGGLKVKVRYDKESGVVFSSGSIISAAIFALATISKFALANGVEYTHIAVVGILSSVAVLFSAGIMIGRRYCVHRRVASEKN